MKKKIIETVATIADAIMPATKQEDLSIYKIDCQLFNDMSEEWLFHDYAIELEVSHESAKKAKALIPAEAQALLREKSESGRICELSYVHKLDKENIKIIYDSLYETYKDKLPIGNDGYLSWWTHFHTFFNNKSDYKKFLQDKFCIRSLLDYWPISNKWIRTVMDFNHLMTQNFSAVPLFFKYHNDILIWRKNQKSVFKTFKWYKDSSDPKHAYRQIWWKYNWGIRTFKDWLFWSIEFRLNQPIDIRLYGFYTWIYMLSLLWMPLQDIWINWDKALKIEINAKWLNKNNTYYRDSTYYCNSINYIPEVKKILDKEYNISCDDIIKTFKTWYKITSKSKKLLIKNLEIVHKVLHANNMPKASEALREYQQEYCIC